MIDNAKLTFTSSQSSFATVGAHTGEVEASTEGTANIEVVLTSKPTLTAMPVVTVTP